MYNLLAGGNCIGSYNIKLPNELDHARKGLINIQNIDDKACFKWYLARYLNPANDHLAIITKAEKGFTIKLDFKDIKFPVKIRNIHKIKKKKSLALMFLLMKTKKNIQSMFKKDVVKKNMLIYY